MTITRKLLLLTFALLITLPLAAATRRRAVQLTPGTEVPVTGQITDAVTNAPVIQADLQSGRLHVLTDIAGKFTMNLPSGRTTVLTVTRSGYETKTLSVTPEGPTTLSTKLTPTPTVRVVMTSGAAYDLDRESAQFAYALPFAGYARSSEGNFCLADGSPYKPTAADLSKVIGPAVSGSSSACCKNPVMTITLEKRGGEKVTAAFVDSCAAFEVDFVGRDHQSGQNRYLRFTEIAQITFP
jgi:hypothetical protein